MPANNNQKSNEFTKFRSKPENVKDKTLKRIPKQNTNPKTKPQTSNKRKNKNEFETKVTQKNKKTNSKTLNTQPKQIPTRKKLKQAFKSETQNYKTETHYSGSKLLFQLKKRIQGPMTSICVTVVFSSLDNVAQRNVCERHVFGLFFLRKTEYEVKMSRHQHESEQFHFFSSAGARNKSLQSPGNLGKRNCAMVASFKGKHLHAVTVQGSM